MLNPCVAACEEIADLLRPPSIGVQPVESIEQLRELFEIDQQAYKDCSLDFGTFEQWWRRYAEGSKVLLKDGAIVASLGIYPLYAEQSAAFEQGRIPESVLAPVTLVECENSPVQTWYASGVVIAESDRGAGSPLRRLLRLGLSAWSNSEHVAYPLQILSIAEYEIGRKILTLLGFKKVRDAAAMPDRCDLYKLQITSSSRASEIIRGLR